MKIIEMKNLVELCRLSRTTIWRLESQGLFPKRVKLSTRRIGWLETDILNWLEAQKGGQYEN